MVYGILTQICICPSKYEALMALEFWMSRVNREVFPEAEFADCWRGQEVTSVASIRERKFMASVGLAG
jgi:hypothetical protein